MHLKSRAFTNEGKIPEKYTCRGANISPELDWDQPPRNAKAFALIVDDPDAPVGTWSHWIVYDIPSEARSLDASVPAVAALDNGAVQGRNSFQKIGYGGPCPPPGHGPHRYFFRLYALDTPLGLKPGASRDEVKAAMSGHILDQASLMGVFER